MSTLINVFVYGTLKPGEVNYQIYLAKRMHTVQAAIALGRLYELPLGYPAMTIGAGWVKGYLLGFPDPELLQALDELEDYDPQRLAELNEYQRCKIKIFSPSQLPLGKAWAYVMTESQIRKLGGTYLPHGNWKSQPRA